MTIRLKKLYDELLEDVTYHKSIAKDGSDHCNCYSCIIDRALHELPIKAKKTLGKNKNTIRDPLPIFINVNHPLHKYGHTFDATIRPHIIGVLDEVIKLTEDEATQQKTQYCGICGRFHRPSSLDSVNLSDGKTYNVCSTCLRSRVRECPDCGMAFFIVSEGAFRRVILLGSKESVVCSSCYMANYIQCGSCGIGEKRVNAIDFTKLPNTRFTNYRRPLWICSKCQKTIENCSSCNLTLLPRDSVTSPKDNKTYCTDCYSLQTVNIQEYNFKAFRLPHLIGTKEKFRKDLLLFGTEIEIEPRDVDMGIPRYEMATRLLDFFGRNKCMIKHDGTVGMGVEFVSFPFSWRWLLENKGLWKDLFEMIKRDGYYAKSGRAGFHVHLSKAAFTSFHLYKFMEFVYRKFNRRFIQIMSERRSNWHFAEFLDSDSNRNIIYNAKTKRNMSEERHSAISLMYTPTVELRIFGGVDRFQEFMKNLEFCRALFLMARDLPPKELRISTFLKYVVKYKNKFPHLVQFVMDSEAIKQYYPKTYREL